MAYTTIDKPTDYFNTVLYTGNGASSHAITGVGFQPDWNWHKIRNDVDWHMIHDSIRLATNAIYSNANNIQGTQATGLKSFDSDGFTVGSLNDSNQNNGLFVSWNWLAGGSGSSNSNGSITSSVSASTDAGFSIVSYTGTGSNATVGHGLGVAPKVVLCKTLDTTAQAWTMYHAGIGATKELRLNTTGAAGTSSIRWQDTNPTSSVFYVGTEAAVNNASTKLIAYCFADVKGYSKVGGSYVGNGSSDGSYIHLGFKPAWVLIKKTSGTGNWCLFDNKRGVNGAMIQLNPDNINADNTSDYIDFLSNGFKCRNTASDKNASGGTYIYMAFAEAPLVNSNDIPNNAR